MSDLPPGFVLDGAAPPQPPQAAAGLPPGFTLDTPPPSNVGAVAAQVPQGINEALYRAAMALPDASSWISKKMGIVPEVAPYPSDALRGSLKVAEVGRAPETKAEHVANSVGDAVGSVFGTLAPGGLLARAKSLGPLAQSIGRLFTANPVQQGVYGAAGAAAGEAAENPYVGTATSLALPLVTHGAQRTFSAAPAATTQEAERRALLEHGRQNDLGPLTAGKILDSRKLQTAESAVSKLPVPLLGGRVQATEEAARNAWQGKALEKAGTYGETAATPSVLDNTRNRIGAKFDALEDSTTVHIDGQFGTDIAKAKADFSKQLLDQMPQSIVKKLDEMAGAAATAGQPGVHSVSLDGESYKNIRSKLSAQLSRSGGTDREAIGGMIDALDGAMERSIPRDMAKDWGDARRLWRNYLALEKSVAANNEQTAKGNMSVAAYGKASRNNPDIERHGQYGSAFIGDKIPNSGTAERSAVPHMLGGAAALYEGLQHAPQATMYGALAGSIPFALDHAMNNPLTRALLLSRHRNSSAPIASPALFGSLAAQQGLQQTK